MDEAGFGIAVLFLVFLFWLYIMLPISMAVSRGRSAVGWVLLTIFLSPIFTIIALLVLGPTVKMALKNMRK